MIKKYSGFFILIFDYILKIKGKIGRNSKCICGSGKKYK
ncbi:MAG: SEC-C domain-containing protein, partial [Malacoplasma sp.]|nr:SEC-C domain-containing protein [Malacoplasma sp.]